MKIKKLNPSLFADLIFTALFIALLYIFGINETMFEPPQSVHIWRQTNSLSMAQNYYQDNLPFFKPQIHSQLSDNGQSGRTAAELPVIYYVVAQLWKLFGNEEWIFRLLHILIIYAGLFLLYKSIQHLLKDKFWAGFISLLVFTSPMVVFYGPNFLPDVPALSFVFIAWYFIMRYVNNRNDKWLWLSALFFSLSMLLKITSALSFVALGGWIVFELVFQKKDQRIFNFNIKQFVPFVLTILVVAAWYLYVEYYNAKHNGHVSVHGIWPIWDVSREQFDRIIDSLNKIYFKEMFFPITQYLTFGIWIYLVVIIRKLKPVFQFFLLVLPAGMLMEIILWFQVFDAHDYYAINLLVVFVAVWTLFLYRLKNFKFYRNPVFYLFGVLFFAWNVVTCKERVETRYTGWMNSMYMDRFKTLTEIEPLLMDLDITRDDKVISIPDFTLNGSLYYMDRKGFTEFGSDLTKEEGFYQRINQGAEYLIVNDSSILSNDYLKPFITNKMGEYKNVSIYDLRHLEEKE